MFRKLSFKDLYIQLIVVNLVIFLFANIAISMKSSFFLDWFAMPLVNPFLKFWTFFTSHFLHIGFNHVFNNMLLLLLFGYYAQYFFKKFAVLSIYVVGGLCGILLMLITNNYIGSSGIAFGASASVFALVTATAMFQPDFPINLFIIGKVKLKWVAIVLVMLTIVINFSDNLLGNMAHIGGALFGMLYGYKARYSTNILWWLDSIFAKISAWFLPKIQTIKTNNTKPTSSRGRGTRYTKPKQSVMNIDNILDKISKHGMKSLSKEEKDYLNR